MSEKTNWYEHKEKTKLGYRLMLFTLKVFPAVFMRFLAYIIGFFYWLFGAKARKFSRDFLQTRSKIAGDRKKSTLSHFISFALNLAENVQSWAGKFKFNCVTWQNDDVGDLVKNINSGKGTLLITSHLGNAQMLKGLATLGESGTEKKMSITTIMDLNISAGFGALLKEINKDSAFQIISSNNIGPDTIILLQDRLEKGEVVVIAGDRISANTERCLNVNFLGRPAKLPYGVFLMVSLLNVPTYFIYGVRHKDLTVNPAYDMFVSKNPLDFDCGRKERENRINQTAQTYIQTLEKQALSHPYQWYNFYSFWD